MAYNATFTRRDNYLVNAIPMARQRPAQTRQAVPPEVPDNRPDPLLRGRGKRLIVGVQVTPCKNLTTLACVCHIQKGGAAALRAA